MPISCKSINPIRDSTSLIGTPAVYPVVKQNGSDETVAVHRKFGRQPIIQADHWEKKAGQAKTLS